jgi:hypothetical protein
VRRPLRHRPSLSAAAGIKRRGFQGQALGGSGQGGIQAEPIERRRRQRLEERDPSRRLRERKERESAPRGREEEGSSGGRSQEACASIGSAVQA